MGDDRPEDAIGEGPYLWIALPATAGYTSTAPVNSTRLLREWEHTTRPAEALSEQFERTRSLGWTMRDWYVEPTFVTVALMRSIANDEFRDRVVASGLKVQLRSRSSFDPQALRDVAEGTSFLEFSSHLDALVYGLAVSWALRHLPGFHSAQLNEIHQGHQIDAAEDQVASFIEDLDEASPDDF